MTGFRELLGAELSMESHLFLELGGDAVAVEKEPKSSRELSKRFHRMLIEV